MENPCYKMCSCTMKWVWGGFVQHSGAGQNHPVVYNNSLNDESCISENDPYCTICPKVCRHLLINISSEMVLHYFCGNFFVWELYKVSERNNTFAPSSSWILYLKGVWGYFWIYGSWIIWKTCLFNLIKPISLGTISSLYFQNALHTFTVLIIHGTMWTYL